ncbi:MULTISPECIES: bifunctional DNA primase/polymerase [unclassified Streptomyces]|uniref:bifunctional DNA primase/polymerase n=1 Tax=unclassified Streptomyces TaxID=2593676 RepID=UPI001BE74AC4|nr:MULTISPECIES: bifunctional DNA primase/polymerase [unclassified Streptomyces]MBT2402830.1 bifunctional DNA primase/polymerase [Streptomyces sp. ISL-21]MBT2454027.1 bifunctional DNA primase/polymerase [Streptomyces sp. ISL-86]MBT2607212.1 bifunctional DNA primase/polymerase [Streptomyces sp. ISL-87]
MTQPTDNWREHRLRLRTALWLAEIGLPVLPLREGKLPVGNCPACSGSACGDRPHMKAAGPCQCPAPCHGWAAATTDRGVLTSPAWATAWRQAGAIAYHPGGARLTVVDLDNPDAVAWAHQNLPATKAVATTRGEHWLYRGAMQSTNGVRPGVDIKSSMSYARWYGPGTGPIVALPDIVRALAVKESASRPVSHAISVPTVADGGQCRHRTPAFLERGIAMAEQSITAAQSAIHSNVYRVFLAVLSTHGRCGCLTETHVERLFTAAHAKGESTRHCTAAWANARTALGL